MEEIKKSKFSTIVRIVIITVILLILVGALYTINKVRELKKKNKFRITGYSVSLGFFPSVDIAYERVM